jgi:hypothetical protein
MKDIEKQFNVGDVLTTQYSGEEDYDEEEDALDVDMQDIPEEVKEDLSEEVKILASEMQDIELEFY